MPGIKDFRDKVVVVTGAGSGIGRATAMAFAAEGANMVIADINKDRITETAKEIERRGGKATAQVTDVSDRAQVEALSKFVIQKHGRVDILHNNAGVGVGALIQDMNLKDWEWIVKINYWGVVYGIHYFLPYMIERRYGHIVNTASGAGLMALPATGAYCSTKFAVVGLSETLRMEVRRYGVGVTVVCPGVINTNIFDDSPMHLPESMRVQPGKFIESVKKYGWPPERVARAVLKGVRKNKAVVPVGPETWIGWYSKRISINLFNAVMNLVTRFSLKET
jgi:NAD(P)-dependent dehydrogenase (short-subunit alcohol dehydrogenase family)